jgi:hypothetical protein
VKLADGFAESFEATPRVQNGPWATDAVMFGLLDVTVKVWASVAPLFASKGTV